MIVKLDGIKQHLNLQPGSKVVLPTDCNITSLPKMHAVYFIPSRECFDAGLEYASIDVGSPVKVLCWTRANSAIQPGMVLGELFIIRVADIG